MNPYEECLGYETNSFRLRPVKLTDAEDLLTCYSDPAAVARMNVDHCTSDFHFTTLEQMQDGITFWLSEMEKKRYIRLAVISKDTGRASGTVEILWGDIGVLRMDLSMEYESDKFTGELLRLAVLNFIPDFQIGSLKVKVSNTPERMDILRKHGFVPSASFRSGYVERTKSHFFDSSKKMAYCGLACCVCSENRNCSGCRKEGCKNAGFCKIFGCCLSRNKNGCWECPEFPCDNPMFRKPRVRAFGRFAAEYGEDMLFQALQKNEADGLLYHYPNQITGDYDLFSDERDIKNLILRGLRSAVRI